MYTYTHTRKGTLYATHTHHRTTRTYTRTRTRTNVTYMITKHPPSYAKPVQALPILKPPEQSKFPQMPACMSGMSAMLPPHLAFVFVCAYVRTCACARACARVCICVCICMCGERGVVVSRGVSVGMFLHESMCVLRGRCVCVCVCVYMLDSI